MTSSTNWSWGDGTAAPAVARSRSSCPGLKGALSAALSADAASRGLDIPDVALVIQVEFAGSAVDYLHRIGRTARAGKKGKVVNISTPQSKDLVRSVRRAIEEGRPVQDAFSRKRSFRKKIKKEAAAKKGRGQ